VVHSPGGTGGSAHCTVVHSQDDSMALMYKVSVPVLVNITFSSCISACLELPQSIYCLSAVRVVIRFLLSAVGLCYARRATSYTSFKNYTIGIVVTIFSLADTLSLSR